MHCHECKKAGRSEEAVGLCTAGLNYIDGALLDSGATRVVGTPRSDRANFL
jgi:hypothetical protein